MRTTVCGPKCSKDREVPLLQHRLLLVYLWEAARLPTTDSEPRCSRVPVVVVPPPPQPLPALPWEALPTTDFEPRCKVAAVPPPPVVPSLPPQQLLV